MEDPSPSRSPYIAACGSWRSSIKISRLLGVHIPRRMGRIHLMILITVDPRVILGAAVRRTIARTLGVLSAIVTEICDTPAPATTDPRRVS